MSKVQSQEAPNDDGIYVYTVSMYNKEEPKSDVGSIIEVDQRV